MIKSFIHRGLRDFWEKGKTNRIPPDLRKRIQGRLDALDGAKILSDLNVPGFDFHALDRQKPLRYTIHVNGNFCITFEWDGEGAVRVDLEDYH